MKLRSLLFACVLGVVPLAASQAQVDVNITVAPPPLRVYEQPPCPTEGYLWTPGYWAYDPDAGYYWTDGLWVAPPRVGYLWTPGYWGYGDGRYAFNQGYWGPSVGFYGGVNYGYGYGGNGYYGGRWENRVFLYNTAITRVNAGVIRHTYVDRAVLNRGVRPGGPSFNGAGGIIARPTARQRAAARAPHLGPVDAQAMRRTAALRAPSTPRQPVNAARANAATARPDAAAARANAAAERRTAARTNAAAARTNTAAARTNAAAARTNAAAATEHANAATARRSRANADRAAASVPQRRTQPVTPRRVAQPTRSLNRTPGGPVAQRAMPRPQPQQGPRGGGSRGPAEGRGKPGKEQRP